MIRAGRVLVGFAIVIGGYALALGSFVALGHASEIVRLVDPVPSFAEQVIVYVLLVGVGTVALWSTKLGRRLAQARGVDIGNDTPPVLLLRAFGRDNTVVAGTKFSGAEWRTPMTFEELLVRQLRSVGPVVALGRPGEFLQPLGAARIYSDDDQWQARVRDLAAKAALIAIVVDDAPNVRWELKTALELSARSRILLVMPPVDAKDGSRPAEWNIGWGRLREEFDFLPQVDNRSAAVAFEADGRPWIVAGEASVESAAESIGRALRSRSAESALP